MISFSFHFNILLFIKFKCTYDEHCRPLSFLSGTTSNRKQNFSACVYISEFIEKKTFQFHTLPPQQWVALMRRWRWLPAAKNKTTWNRRRRGVSRAGISKQDALALRLFVTTCRAAVWRAGKNLVAVERLAASSHKREVRTDTFGTWKKGRASLCCPEKVSEWPVAVLAEWLALLDQPRWLRTCKNRFTGGPQWMTANLKNVYEGYVEYLYIWRISCRLNVNCKKNKRNATA